MSAQNTATGEHAYDQAADDRIIDKSILESNVTTHGGTYQDQNDLESQKARDVSEVRAHNKQVEQNTNSNPPKEGNRSKVAKLINIHESKTPAKNNTCSNSLGEHKSSNTDNVKTSERQITTSVQENTLQQGDMKTLDTISSGNNNQLPTSDPAHLANTVIEGTNSSVQTRANKEPVNGLNKSGTHIQEGNKNEVETTSQNTHGNALALQAGRVVTEDGNTPTLDNYNNGQSTRVYSCNSHMDNISSNVTDDNKKPTTNLETIANNVNEGIINHEVKDGNATKSETFTVTNDISNIVVGLHIGTTKCGFAYGHGTTVSASNTIFLNEPWVNEFGSSTITMPMAVLFEIGKTSAIPVKFGYEALITYKTESDPDRYFLCETYTSALLKGKSDSLKLTTGQYLDFIFNKLRESIEGQLQKNGFWSGKNRPTIKWVITHDGVIKDKIPDIIEKLAKDEYVRLINEDEAAALWCVNMPIFEFTKEEDHSLPVGTHFCVMDFESEYISIFEKTDTSQLVKTERSDKGSFRIDWDTDIESLFCKIFDSTNVSAYRRNYSRDWFVMVRQLITQIHGFNPNQDMDFIVSLPFTLVKYLEKENKKTISEYIKECIELSNVVSYNNGSLNISSEYFRNKLERCAGSILNRLNKLAIQRPIDFLFLIGRTAMLEGPISELIKDSKFKETTICKIKVPQDLNACALKGAVLREIVDQN